MGDIFLNERGESEKVSHGVSPITRHTEKSQTRWQPCRGRSVGSDQWKERRGARGVRLARMVRMMVGMLGSLPLNVC